MSEHPTERELVLYVTGDADGPDEVEAHLQGCDPCRRKERQVLQLLGMTRGAHVREPDVDFEARIWRRVRAEMDPSLFRDTRAAGPSPGILDRLRGWLTPRRMVLVASTAAAVTVAFLVGLLLPPPTGTPLAPSAAAGDDVRERILLVSVGEHLERSQMVLVELVNAEADGPLDLRAQQRAARNLLADNRLYRQSARMGGQPVVADLLEELERVLLEVAHGPGELPAEELEWLRERITSRDLLFRVRVVEETVRRERTEPAAGSVG